jgi:hypothetical protein
MDLGRYQVAANFAATPELHNNLWSLLTPLPLLSRISPLHIFPS